jgi:hypothetical protein
VKGVLSQTFQTNQIAEELEAGTDISYQIKPKQLRFSFEERQAFREL